SFDATAESIGNMFDFNPEAKRAPKLFLDPDTGLVVKTPPNGTPSGNPTPTPTPTSTSVSVDTTVSGDVDDQGDDNDDQGGRRSVNAAPVTASSGTPVKLKLSCTGKRSGKSYAVACTATGTDAKAKGIAVRFRLVKGSKVLATTRTTLSGGKVKA